MKPDWENAPSWANYLAISRCGAWAWYECCPQYEAGEWHALSGTRWHIAIWIDSSEDIPYGYDALEGRPL
ncbi:hypothetical protein ADT27_13445 [Xanthomonas oryzae]|nr:hypothetical protein ADT27_13445 [Xanthomonas oryzae]